MRVVVDTNVIVSRFLSQTGPPGSIYAYLIQRRFEFIASPEILAEYSTVLLRPALMNAHRTDVVEVTEAVVLMTRPAHVVSPTVRLPGITADPKDDKFIECAVEGGADVIVSGDKHLLELGSYEGIQIVSPAAFVMYLAMESPAE